MYTNVGLACTGDFLSEKMRDGDQGTQVTPQRRFLRLLAPQAPLAAPAPPPNALPRTPKVSPPPVHLLHGCTR
jgi:hypothetical protein